MNRLMLVAALPVLAAGCAAASAAERSFPVSAFKQVAAAGSEDIIITTGNTASVVATGPEERLDELNIRVEGDTLKIGHKKNSSWGMTRGKTVIRITTPMLHGVSLSGSGDLTADKGSGPAFTVSLAGSGDVKIAEIETQAAKFSTAGSGDITAAGTCQTAKVSISGSGDIDVGGLKCTNIDIGISGSGDVSAYATGMADIRISGSGDVTIRGGGKCKSRTSGSGEVSCG